MDKYTALKQYFGHTAFRPGQEALIDALLAGRDVLGVMPTGAGKSVCYQIPALLLPGVTLVVSPLISLMKDQVAALTQAGVPVAFINSSLSAAQYREVFRRAGAGQYKLIYVAPERLDTADFLRFAAGTKISLVAVDEAHCVSQWGQDFRPSYLKIIEFVARLAERPVVGAFTATATEEVTADIVRLLCLREPLCLTTGFDRPNLRFSVLTPKGKPTWLRAFLAERPGRSGIVYCATRASVERVCDELCRSGVAATRYHAGLEDDERRRNQEDFVYDRARVMVATNAFGMGIDKSNVSFVVHYNMPKNLESYYQEAGRAGRDGEPAECVLLFASSDVRTARFLIENGSDNEALSDAERAEVQRRERERLAVMVGYCKTGGCLRAYLLNYFGEPHPGHCGNCGNCAADRVETDITVEAQKILSCVARAEKLHPYGLGLNLYVNALHGSREQRVLQLRLDTLPTYGLLREVPRTRIRACIDRLLDEGYLQLSGEEYPVLRLTERSGAVLYRGQRVTLTETRRPADQTAAAPRRRRNAAPAEEDSDLLAALKALRGRLAAEAGIPAYLIFSNAALADMAARAPRTMSEFLDVSGVGEVKAKRYGKAFLETIRAF